jgi:transposase
MAAKHRPSFSPEFKLEAAQLVTERSYSVAEAAKAIAKNP